MTNAELRAQLAKIDSARAAARDAITDAAAPPTTGADRLGAAFTNGDRVFDLLGGGYGAVVDVTPASGRHGALFDVRFDDGAFGLRRAVDLIHRPTPPAGRADGDTR